MLMADLSRLIHLVDNLDQWLLFYYIWNKNIFFSEIEIVAGRTEKLDNMVLTIKTTCVEDSGPLIA